MAASRDAVARSVSVRLREVRVFGFGRGNDCFLEEVSRSEAVAPAISKLNAQTRRFRSQLLIGMLRAKTSSADSTIASARYAYVSRDAPRSNPLPALAVAVAVAVAVALKRKDENRSSSEGVDGDGATRKNPLRRASRPWSRPRPRLSARPHRPPKHSEGRDERPQGSRDRSRRSPRPARISGHAPKGTRGWSRRPRRQRRRAGHESSEEHTEAPRHGDFQARP